MGNEKLAMTVATHKLALAMDLDPSIKTIDCMKEYYESRNRMFVVSDFIGQGYKDLYMLANIKGSFSEHDIAQIAVQLLKGVGYLHHQGIYLRNLKPQSIVITEGFKPFSKIKLKISDIATSLLIQERNPEWYLQVSGVDNLFIAPELYKKNEATPLNDVWSIGAILYLLITGGDDKNVDEEKFLFREQQWLSVSEELMEFMLGCVTVNPKKRQSISDLQSHNFIKMYQNNKLDCTPMEYTVVTDHGANLYKFQTASVINSIVHRRKSLNLQKMKKIESIYEEFNM